MNIDIEAVHFTMSEQLRRYVSAMTREVLRGVSSEPSRVAVRIRREEHGSGTVRFHCDVRVTRARGELVFDGSARHPHAAVEQALEQLWHLLRTHGGENAA